MPEKREEKPLERFRSVFTEIPAPKGGLPTMPREISKESSESLGDLISRYSAWREFTEDRHMESCAVYSQLRSTYDLASDKAMLSSSDSTITEKKARAKIDAVVAPLAKKVLEAEIYRDLLAGKLESFTNVLTMLSRELTRRGVNM
jgi:hypothetical protein